MLSGCRIASHGLQPYAYEQFAPTMPRRSLRSIDQYAGGIDSADRVPRARLEHDWLAWHIASARKASSLGALSGFSNDPTPRHRKGTYCCQEREPSRATSRRLLQITLILAHADTEPAQRKGRYGVIYRLGSTQQ
jgi:hypothetical protein